MTKIQDWQKNELVNWFGKNMGKFERNKQGKDERTIVFRCHPKDCSCSYCLENFYRPNN